MLQTASKSHDALELSLVFLRIQTSPLLGLLASGLCRSTGLEFSRNSLKVEGHLRIRLEEEQLQIPCLVLELDLGAVLEDIRDGAINSKQGEDLAPMRALDHIKTRHERLLFLLGPGTSRRMRSFSSSVGCRLGESSLPGLIVEIRA